MTDIVLKDITSGYNYTRINDNFEKIEDVINDEVVHRVGGNNVMEQDLDMNGHTLLNVYINPSSPSGLLTVEAADTRYYNVSGDQLQGTMDVNGKSIIGLPVPTEASSPTRKDQLDVAVAAYQAGDANLQAQLTGNVPLEASAFSELSWHGQFINNSVTIPSSKNAWSFGPQVEIKSGQAVTIGNGSFWTIANGRVVNSSDLHQLIADTITTTDGSKTVNVNDVAKSTDLTTTNTRVTTAEGNISSLQSRMTAEENKVQPVALGGTGNTTGNAPTASKLLTARTISATGDATWSVSFDGSSNATGALTLANSTVTAGTYARVAVNAKGIVTGGNVTLPVANGGTGATDAASARTALSAAASGANSDITSLSGLTTPLSVAQGGTGGTSQPYTRANYLGTVSQASGVPTGAAIERGSNTNGSYVKFADGTMICTSEGATGMLTGTLAANGASSATYTLPATFANNTFVVMAGCSPTTSVDHYGVINAYPASTNSTTLVIRNGATAQTFTSRYVATGRWF